MKYTLEMAYIPNDYKKTKEQLDKILADMGERDPTWETLLMVNYAYHHQDSDYDGGLSFLDSLNRKIGRFNADWDIEMFKDKIRTADDPQTYYVFIIKSMLKNPSHVLYYGV